MYHVFLSHNSVDKPQVRAVADWLRLHQVNVWLDEANLEPGDVFSEKLGQAMEDSHSAVIFLGPNGEGRWQGEEINTLQNKAIRLHREKNEFRLIPVLLPNADSSKLHWFLQSRLWIDLSRGVTDNSAELHRLKQAILGKSAAQTDSIDPHVNPYKGLGAFQPDDVRFFFGRDRASADLATKLSESKLACIVGASGNGKSSLARAGLSSEAAERACPGIRSWPRLIWTPGTHFFRSLLEQLYRELPNEKRPTAVGEALKRIGPDESKTGEDLAISLNQELSAFYSAHDGPVLLIIDQLEELFIYHDGNPDAQKQQARRVHTLDCLARMREVGKTRFRIVLTLRDDFRERFRASAEFWKCLSDERFKLDLDELDDDGWREAIKGPAARAGAYLEEGLVSTMLKDVSRQRGSMPLLQLALEELWKARDGGCLTHAAYNRIGGIAKAIQLRATNALRVLKNENPEFPEIARQLFLRLVSIGDGVPDTRRRIKRHEYNWENTDPKNVQHVVTKLSEPDHRLIVANSHFIEVTHEVLIRESDEIRQWLDGRDGVRGDILLLRQLTYASRAWLDAEKSDDMLLAPGHIPGFDRFRKGSTLWLTTDERDFLKKSRARHAQHLRLKRQRDREERKSKNKEARNAKFLSQIKRSLQWASAISVVALLVSTGVNLYAKYQSKKSLETATPGHPFVNTLGMKFVRVPGTRVAFSIWETRVRDFTAFVKATRYDAGNNDNTNWKNPGFEQTEDHPVCMVSYIDATNFCTWLSLKEGKVYRLPTDLEWSAAVGLTNEIGSTPEERSRNDTNNSVYPWGTNWPPIVDGKPTGNFYDRIGYGFKDGFSFTAPVGQFASNPFGIFDLAGNLWEWCDDRYDGTSQVRVLRGGSWVNGNPVSLLSSYRGRNVPGARRDSDGFRCVVEMGGAARWWPLTLFLFGFCLLCLSVFALFLVFTAKRSNLPANSATA